MDIPPAPDTPYGLQLMLDVWRAEYLQMVMNMRSPKYRVKLEAEIEAEKVISFLCGVF